MSKINNNSNKQVQTELFLHVEPSKKVYVSFTSTGCLLSGDCLR